MVLYNNLCLSNTKITARNVFVRRCMIVCEAKQHWLFPVDRYPVSAKYLDKKQIERINLEEWKEITRQERPDEMSIWSTLMYIPYWIKYTIIPMWMRYIWFKIWSFVRFYLYLLHKWAVLQGAKVDAFLTRVGSRGKRKGFSQGIVLQRYRGKRGVFRDTIYRFKLLLGIDQTLRNQNQQELQVVQ
eukprot:TRINITY_DN8487_c0_g1_i6.p2 TRINITY_DN8487_c0_g1~~TRINITY_DN8487_c0_g1_i6.p2  ORF type:complete len:186 (-),score=6.36 TRINITY_DN8487_c0_g1_i6:155-712(-)